MKKIIVASLLAAILIASCSKPLERVRTDNPSYTPELLFTLEDKRVYRFYDNGTTVYIVMGDNITTRHSDGKKGTVLSITDQSF